MNAEIIAVGSELLTPYRLDTNSLFLTGELNKLGIRVLRKTIVGDDRQHLRDAFRGGLDRADLVISCGGLGPTEDDITRVTLAELLGRNLKRNEEILRKIQERFHKLGRAMPEINIRQAMVPEGAVVLENTRGTAPGLWIEVGDKLFVLLPGPPAELQALFAKEVAPKLARHSGKLHLFARDLRITGMSESEVEQRVTPIYAKFAGIETTILTSPGEIQLHPRIWSEDEAAATKLLDDMVKEISMALGENLFSVLGEVLEEVVTRQLQEHHATIAVAESCTGGMLAERLTNVPGSSSFFRGGVVSYSNDLKTAWAAVPETLIDAHGAVSAEVALAMAGGIRRRTSATFGLGVTGIAGPGGGSAEKPVGLVHIAIADEKGPRERKFHFPGDRDRIRRQASQAALDMVRRHFLHSSRAKG